MDLWCSVLELHSFPRFKMRRVKLSGLPRSFFDVIRRHMGQTVVFSLSKKNFFKIVDK